MGGQSTGPKTPKTVQGTVIAVGWSRELDETLLLKTSHTSVIEHGKKIPS